MSGMARREKGGVLSVRARCLWGGAPFLAVAWLAGCATADQAGPARAPAAVEARPHEAQTIPAGAVAVGKDLYQVPLGSDADGCLMYRLHSPARLVPLAISYQAPDGSFTMDHHHALCDPDLIRRR